MALSKAVLEMLATIGDEEDRKILTAQFEKYEPIQERFAGNLRQSDYDRQMNESKKAVEEAVARAKRWQDWADENKPKHETLLTQWKATRERNEAIEKELKEANEKLAKAGTGGGAGGEDVISKQELEQAVEQRLAGRNYVSKEELANIVKQETDKIADARTEAFTKEFNTKTMPSMLHWVQQGVQLQFRHRDEFGQPLDEQKFAKFMVDSKIDDQNRAYEQYTAEARKEKETKALRDEIEKDVRSKLNLPGTGASPTPELGAVEAMRQGRKDAPPNLDSMVPGTGALAAAAAAELRQEGKV
jgi:hypothetical protein